MEIDKTIESLNRIDKNIQSQNEFVLGLQKQLTDLTLEHKSLEIVFSILLVSISESSPELGIELKNHAESALKSLPKDGALIPYLEKMLKIACGQYDKKPPHLWLLPPRSSS
ncbi:MAG: hypothetical protein VR65_04445 [Desulfobulbaceae bacterium BRH_c16a]|nr:MAG: hypothetical protein VR65_04445 [Desulfobulbaceae bacterium BRH_c16a]